MKISVIIPTYNRVNLIKKTLDSVLNQTVKVDEIIVIDDGSTDTTQNLLKNYKDIIYIKQNNQGVSSARNTGIKASKNAWIAFLDSDDIWENKKIEKQISFHKQNPDILFSHTNEQWIFNDKVIKQKKHQQKPSGDCFLENISHCLIGPSTVMIHKNILEDVGLFDEDLKVCEDFDLWLRVLYKYKLGLLEDVLLKKIAGHDEQLSFSTPLMDSYRIKALLKHTDCKYALEVKSEIIKKCEIMIKGAIKHKNSEVESIYSNLKEKLISNK